MKKAPRRWRTWAVGILLFLLLLNGYRALHSNTSSAKVPYSAVVSRIAEDPSSVQSVIIDPHQMKVAASFTKNSLGQKRKPEILRANIPTVKDSEDLQVLLRKKGIPYDGKAEAKPSIFLALLVKLLPILLLFGLLIFLLKRQGGAGNLMGFAKSGAKKIAPDAPKVTFKDVAGIDEVIEELREIKEFLSNPKKFQALGARIPKGVLLYGPPGCGKTLCARAVAGEAGVPFFSISGSNFVEMFVGVGASRVRDLFTNAKASVPCIVFVDEIDAVGRHRGAGLGGGHDEREQTLNQLLVEMDGFEMRDTVIVMAATNRPDILDPALLRPGRFDRQIVIDRPDRVGRRKILDVHTNGKPLGERVSLDKLAAGTPGFTGADLENLVNEAALLAARRNKRFISQLELEDSIMRVVAGPKKARLLSEEERKTVAYHEMGHALVGHFLEECDPVHKISAVGYGQALGVTVSLPEEDQHLQRKSKLLDDMAMMLGGRAAEALVFGEERVTTGASNDLVRVTQLAKEMATRYAMFNELGKRTYGSSHGPMFLGRDIVEGRDYSEKKSEEIDRVMQRIAEQAYQRARTVLSDHEALLHSLSALLMEHETIDGEQFERLIAGESPETVFAPSVTADDES